MTSPPADPTTPPVPLGLVLAPVPVLRFDPSRVALADVLAPPYDVISPAARAELAARDPHNVVRLTLPDAPSPEEGYAQAAAALARWEADGVLVADEPALWVYEITSPEGHVLRGLVGGVGLAQPDAGIVLPHENTMAGPVADRLGLLEAVAADLEPIFLVYDGGGAASAAVAADPSEVTADLTVEDGSRHRLWAVRDAAQLAAVAADLLPRRAVIADGHHRYATYLQHQSRRHAEGRGPGPWDLGLTLLVDGSAYGPEVHPIHRVVPGLPADEAAALAGAGYRLAEVEVPDSDADLASTLAAAGPHSVVISDGVRAWLLDQSDPAGVAAAMPAERSAAWQDLDVAVAHRYLIGALWGLADDEEVVHFEHDVADALGAARASEGTALLLPPTPVQAVVDVAASGERMPRKSTLFTPKPRSGMVLRPHR